MMIRINRTNRAKKKSSLHSLSNEKSKSIKDLLELLKVMKVYDDYYVEAKTYMDTVESYKYSYNASTVSAEWINLHDIEKIYIDGR